VREVAKIRRPNNQFWMEVEADRFPHTLGDESSYPSRPRPQSKSHEMDAAELEWRKPDPDPDEACLLDHPSYSPPTLSSNSVIFINLLKSNIGAGFLALPYAFSNFGLVAGCLAMPAVIGAACVGMRLLVGVKVKLRDSDSRTKSDIELTYPAIAKTLLGNWGHWIVIVSLFVSQLGSCTAYLIFWGNLFTSVSTFEDIPRQAAIGVGMAIVLPLSCITNPRGLRWSSFLGLTLVMISLMALFSYCTVEAAADPTNDAPQDFKNFDTDMNKFPRFFGISSFAMEGITVVLPLEQSARKRSYFPMLMTTAMLLCGALYGAFGALGYAVYGSMIEESILKNLPSSSTYVTVLEMLIGLNLMATYPVQMFPISEVLDQWVGEGAERPAFWKMLLIRFVLVGTTGGAAMVVHDFGDTLSIIGGFSFMAIGVIVPILLYIAQNKEEMSMCTMVGLIIIVGQAVSISLLLTAMSCYNLFEEELDTL